MGRHRLLLPLAKFARTYEDRLNNLGLGLYLPGIAAVFDFAENHAPRGGLQDTGDRHLHLLADEAAGGFNDHHGAVVQIGTPPPAGVGIAASTNSTFSGLCCCRRFRISSPRRPRVRRSSSGESAIYCSSSRINLGTRKVPSRTPVSEMSAMRPSMMTLVSRIFRGARSCRPMSRT